MAAHTGDRLRRNTLFHPALTALLLAVSFLAGCRGCSTGGPSLPAPNVDDIEAGLQVVRAERLLKHAFQPSFLSEWETFSQEHPRFAAYYSQYLLRIPPSEGGGLDTATSGLLWRTYVAPPVMQELADTVQDRLGDLSKPIAALEKAYQYHHYYLPDDTLPPLYTYSGVFGQPVEWTPDFMAVALTMFLGRDFSGYKGFSSENLPHYLFHRLEPEQIPLRVMDVIARVRWEPNLADNTALSVMLYEGKLLAYQDRVFPRTPDSLKIGYTAAQLAWAETNQAPAWDMLVTEELLFSRRGGDVNRLTGESPSTKGMAPESPGRMGTWIGWQIVRSYLERNPQTSLDELFAMQDPQAFLEASRWKPERR